MIFHENCLLPYFFRKLGKMSQNVSAAAVVIGALRVIMKLQSTISIWKCGTSSFAAKLQNEGKMKDRRLRFSPKFIKITLLHVQCKIA